jgi:hypothetical protein
MRRRPPICHHRKEIYHQRFELKICFKISYLKTFLLTFISRTVTETVPTIVPVPDQVPATCRDCLPISIQTQVHHAVLRRLRQGTTGALKTSSFEFRFSIPLVADNLTHSRQSTAFTLIHQFNSILNSSH